MAALHNEDASCPRPYLQERNSRKKKSVPVPSVSGVPRQRARGQALSFLSHSEWLKQVSQVPSSSIDPAVSISGVANVSSVPAAFAQLDTALSVVKQHLDTHQNGDIAEDLLTVFLFFLVNLPTSSW